MGRNAESFVRGLLETAGVSIDGPEPWSLHVHHQGLWDRVVSQRQLGLGEAYMDGWWDCDQMDEMLTRIVSSGVDGQVRLSPALGAMAARSWAINRQTKARADANAKHHYDIGNDLYDRMLESRMLYSCAYWKDASTLDEAQVAKLELICTKLHLEPGMRVLDIGCGWGGFLAHAATTKGVRGVGISPAGNQVAVARERTRDLDVKIEQGDYRDLRGKFDRIVSVGMMEHVGPRNLKKFFDVCDSLLVPDGMMLHHTIGSLVSKHHTDAFFDKYIFPGGVVPSLAQFNRAAEPRWVVEDVHNFGPYYDRTLMAWEHNIAAAAELRSTTRFADSKIRIAAN